MPLSCFTYKIATCLVFSAVVKCKSRYAIAQLTACHWLPVALGMKLKCISWPLWLRIVSLLCTSLFLFLATLWIALYSPVILTLFFENTEYSPIYGFCYSVPTSQTFSLSTIYCLSPTYPL